jgi:hypothetical protein
MAKRVREAAEQIPVWALGIAIPLSITAVFAIPALYDAQHPNHHLWWWPTWWMLAPVLLFVGATVLAVWQTLHHSDGPVSYEHLAQLRRIASSVRVSIHRTTSCAYLDPEGDGNPALLEYREALRIHCPELIGPLDAWDAALASEGGLMDALMDRIRTDATVARMTEPPWLIDGLVDGIASVTNNRAMTDTLGADFDDELRYDSDTGFFWLQKNQWPIRTLGDLWTFDGAERERYRFRVLLAESQSTPEAVAIRDTILKRDAIMATAITALNTMLASHSVVEQRCPLC